MEPLGAALNLQVLCLQYTYENPPPTIAELAKTLIVVSDLRKNKKNVTYRRLNFKSGCLNYLSSI
jgi:hypothetical protein